MESLSELQRIGLFLTVCILARLLLAYLAKYIAVDSEYKNFKFALDIICFGIGVSFIYQYFKGNKVDVFGGKVWWGDLRLIHACNYLAYSYLSYNNVAWAYLVLVFDVIIGLTGFLMHRMTIDGWKWVVDRGGLVKPIIR